MFLGQNILGSLKDISVLSYLVVFWVGFLMSLGICSAVRLPLVFGYTSGNSDSKKSMVIAVYFTAGMIFAYILVGITIGIFSSILNKLFSWQKYTYYVMGLVTLIISFNFLGFIDFSSHHLNLAQNKIIKKFSLLGNFGAFFLGLVFVFMEGLIAPCCGPIIYILTAFTLLKGKFLLGISLFFIYGLGQATPIFIAGSFATFIKKINVIQNNWEYVEVSLGLVLLLLSVYFFVIA